jgi:hypothetical protein
MTRVVECCKYSAGISDRNIRPNTKKKDGEGKCSLRSSSDESPRPYLRRRIAASTPAAAKTAVNPGALFAGVVVAVGFTFVGAGVTCLPGGAAVTAPAAGRGGTWAIGCFAAGICWR